MNNKQTKVTQNQSAQTEDAMIIEIKKELAEEMNAIEEEFEEIFNEMEAYNREVQEEMAADSPQRQRDELITHISSISIGFIMTVVGVILLVKVRKMSDNIGKKKIAGWILAGLGAGIMVLHIVQMIM